MKLSDIKCCKCGSTVQAAAERGAWLERTAPKRKGIGMIMECRPSCKSHTKENAVVACLNATGEEK